VILQLPPLVKIEPLGWTRYSSTYGAVLDGGRSENISGISQFPICVIDKFKWFDNIRRGYHLLQFGSILALVSHTFHFRPVNTLQLGAIGQLLHSFVVIDLVCFLWSTKSDTPLAISTLHMCFEAILRVKYATEHSIIRGFVTREIGKMTPRGWRRIHKILLPLRVWRRPCICGSRPKVHARYSRSKDRRSCLRGLAQERVSRFQLMPYLYTK
jgi:hypothetical protein